MTKALAKKESTALVADTAKAWGDTPKIDTADILIPRLILMQKGSQFVEDGKCQAGDFVYTKTGAKAAAPVKFVPITTGKSYAICELVDGVYKTRRYEDVPTSSTWEWDEGGTKWRRDECFNFYVLLVDDIEKEKHMLEAAAAGEMPDPDNVLLPTMLTFKRSGKPAAKVLTTYFLKCQALTVPCNPAVKTFTLASEKIKDAAARSYHVPVVTSFGMSDPHYVKIAEKWNAIITQNKAKITIDVDIDDIDAQALDKDAERFMA